MPNGSAVASKRSLILPQQHDPTNNPAIRPVRLHTMRAGECLHGGCWGSGAGDMPTMQNGSNRNHSDRPEEATYLMDTDEAADYFLRAQGYCPRCAASIPDWWKPYYCLGCIDHTAEEAQAWAAAEDDYEWGSMGV